MALNIQQVSVRNKKKEERKCITGGISGSTQFPLLLSYCKPMSISNPLPLIKIHQQAAKSCTGTLNLDRNEALTHLRFVKA